VDPGEEWLRPRHKSGLAALDIQMLLSGTWYSMLGLEECVLGPEPPWFLLGSMPFLHPLKMNIKRILIDFDLPLV